MRYYWLRKTAFAFVAGLALLLPAAMAEACEIVEDRPTPMELEKEALAFFKQEALIYEGIILGGHDYEMGGRFLVLKVYKGPAKPFTILRLPPGSSCYMSVTSFSVGFWSDYSVTPISFEGLVSPDYVDSWKRHGLVDDGVLTPSRLIFAFPLLIIALITFIAWRLRRRRNSSV